MRDFQHEENWVEKKRNWSVNPTLDKTFIFLEVFARISSAQLQLKLDERRESRAPNARPFAGEN